MTETIGPAESKICIIQPFKEMFVNLLFRESQILNLAHHIDEFVYGSIKAGIKS